MAPRRPTPLASAAVAAALAAAALTGCSAIEKALDCATVASEVAANVSDLQEAIGNAGDNPQAASDALDAIDKNLQELGDKTGDTDVNAAVDDLTQGVQDTRTAIDRGEVPDISPIQDAAGELTRVCTPG